MSRLETSGLLAVRSGFLARAFSLPSVTLSTLDFCAPARAVQTSGYSRSEHFPQSTLERFRTRSTSSTPVRQGSRSGEFQPDPNVAAPARGRAMAPGVAGLPNGATRSRRRRYSASSRSRFHTLSASTLQRKFTFALPHARRSAAFQAYSPSGIPSPPSVRRARAGRRVLRAPAVRASRQPGLRWVARRGPPGPCRSPVALRDDLRSCHRAAARRAFPSSRVDVRRRVLAQASRSACR